MQPNVPPNAPSTATPAQPASKTSRTGLIVAIVVGLLVLCCCPIAILTAIAVPAFTNYLRRAKVSEARSELSTIASAEESWCSEHGTYLAPAGPLPAGAPGPEKQVGSFQLDPTFSQLGYDPYGALYYQYSIVQEMGGILIRAEGDLDGDAVRSRFELRCNATCTCMRPPMVTDELE